MKPRRYWGNFILCRTHYLIEVFCVNRIIIKGYDVMQNEFGYYIEFFFALLQQELRSRFAYHHGSFVLLQEGVAIPSTRFVLPFGGDVCLFALTI